MNPDTAKKMLIDTDYPLDKVVYMNSGSITIAASSFGSQSYPHGLSFTPLPVLSWSLDSNFTTSYIPGFFAYADISVTEKLTGYSDATNLTIFASNDSGSSKTFYWRAYCLMPYGANVDASFTASSSDNFVMNTDYNYSKLYLSGITGLTATSITINHGLGYKPRQVLLWKENMSGEIDILDFNTTDTSVTNKVLINNSDLVFYDSGGSDKLHYRIYLDD